MEVNLQPQVLRWARERAGLSVANLAKKLATKPEKVTAWEETGRLNFGQAERLAKAAHVPFGYLYFPVPPDESLPIEDFRTVGSGVVDTPSFALLDTLYDVQRKQEWYREYLLQEGDEPVAFVGSLSISSRPVSVAQHLRTELRLPHPFQIQGNTSHVMRSYVTALEEQRILVMRSGIVENNTSRPLDVEEFRGFALADRYAPIIFVNSRDAITARIFTLIHELVHIGLGQSGVSNSFAGQESVPSVERFCNIVAAEFLVPSADIKSIWSHTKKEDEWLLSLSKKFKVSTLVILRRARDLSLISDKEYRQLTDKEKKQFLSKSEKEEKSGNFYVTQTARHGTPFVRALAAETLAGRTPYREALGLLGIKNISAFHKLAQKVLTQSGGEA